MLSKNSLLHACLTLGMCRHTFCERVWAPLFRLENLKRQLLLSKDRSGPSKLVFVFVFHLETLEKLK